MTNSKKSWTNQEIMHEFLWSIVEHIYETASQSAETICEEMSEEDSKHLKNRLVEIQGAVVDRIFSLIDGRTGPTYWPGIKLVNAETGEQLTEGLDWEFSAVEGEFLDSLEVSSQDN